MLTNEILFSIYFNLYFLPQKQDYPTEPSSEISNNF
ncbi:hypothetical protein SAMN05421664_1459 [Chryseobacterium soldanellicola]|uniref:Uncharacterized protein n=1 Tax=Chryseobacterium soldanellicola TaxID=311333 RepID=A0A1H1ALD0_9FLAO|nr:hypothetical protein SAMN05421664_1459 [Chryseobacterium soldanellicola]